MNIRPARPEEGELLTALAIEAKATWGYTAAHMARWTDELRISAQSILDEPTFVAEDDGQTLGVAQLRTAQDPWVLEHLWVRPSVMRRGVGRRLVHHVLAFASECGHRELLLHSDPHAERFYQQLGARRIGEVAAPIEGHPDRVLPRMVLTTVKCGLSVGSR